RLEAQGSENSIEALIIKNNMAHAFLDKNAIQAELLYRELVARAEEQLPEGSRYRFVIRQNHALALERGGRAKEADETLRELLAEAKTLLGDDDLEVVAIQRSLRRIEESEETRVAAGQSKFALEGFRDRQSQKKAKSTEPDRQ
ncbi:MAG: hypothetical protein KDB53_17225, partial [Planctomycetes bacterium]|nr:hypothetical protein [Planctomycetota bacterium]